MATKMVKPREEGKFTSIMIKARVTQKGPAPRSLSYLYIHLCIHQSNCLLPQSGGAGGPGSNAGTNGGDGGIGVPSSKCLCVHQETN